jgi:oligoendopeptidase F
MRPHQLSDEVEKLLHEKSVAGRAAWVRLFDETLAGLRFDVDGRQLSLSETLNLLSDKNGATRRSAAKALGRVLGTNLKLFTLITNTLAKDKQIEDDWRISATGVGRNLSNLSRTSGRSPGRLGARGLPVAWPSYYRLKAKWFGVEKLDYWTATRRCPRMPIAVLVGRGKEDRAGAYGAFTPDMAAIATRFFDERWIDVPPRPGKDSGAFSHSTVPSAHPFILLNYHGKARDVMTLAHELGHGVHQVLAGRQGALMADTSLPLAETASVFGEMLTFRALLDGEKDPGRRRILLAGKVEDMLNTVVRQIAFHEFETRVHGERRKTNGRRAPVRNLARGSGRKSGAGAPF